MLGAQEFKGDTEMTNNEKAYSLYKDGEVNAKSKAEALEIIAEAKRMDKEYSNGKAEYGYIQVFKNSYIVKQF